MYCKSAHFAIRAARVSRGGKIEDNEGIEEIFGYFKTNTCTRSFRIELSMGAVTRVGMIVGTVHCHSSGPYFAGSLLCLDESGHHVMP